MANQEISHAWLITGSSTGFGHTPAEAALAQGDHFTFSVAADS